MAKEKSGILDQIKKTKKVIDSRNAQFHKIEKPSKADANKGLSTAEARKANAGTAKRNDWKPLTQVIMDEEASTDKRETASKSKRSGRTAAKTKQGTSKTKRKSAKTSKKKTYTAEQYRHKKKRQMKRRLLVQLFEEIGAFVIETMDKSLDKFEDLLKAF